MPFWRESDRGVNQDVLASRRTCSNVGRHRRGIDPERRRQLRAKALEHLEAARACMDESGDGMGNYLVERDIDEITSQQWPSLDPFSEEWPTKQKPAR
jgi:hypothetical protein